MPSSVAKFVRLGTTVVGSGEIRVSVRLNEGTLMGLSICKLYAYVSGRRYDLSPFGARIHKDTIAI